MAAKIDRGSELLKRAHKWGNPIIRGEAVTFIWHGRSAPDLVSDLDGWEEGSRPLKRISRDVWGISLKLPRDAYLEYSFYDPRTRQFHADPLNAKSVSNGVGGRNQFFYMPDAAPTPLTRPSQTQGQLIRHQVDADGLAVHRKRTVYLYRPPVNRPVPLVVVLDGLEYLRRVRITQIVDNLIAQKRIRPIALALVQNGGNQGRTVEYACSEATLAFLKNTVLPLAVSHLNLVDIQKHPGAYGIVGSSLGGLMAIFTTLRLPEIFGCAISQSGAFELWGIETVAMQLVRSIQKPDIALWMDIGRLEELLECNRRMHSLLRSQGYEVGYHEFVGGHNTTCWRDDLGSGLKALFC